MKFKVLQNQAANGKNMINISLNEFDEFDSCEFVLSFSIEDIIREVNNDTIDLSYMLNDDDDISNGSDDSNFEIAHFDDTNTQMSMTPQMNFGSFNYFDNIVQNNDINFNLWQNWSFIPKSSLIPPNNFFVPPISQPIMMNIPSKVESSITNSTAQFNGENYDIDGQVGIFSQSLKENETKEEKKKRLLRLKNCIASRKCLQKKHDKIAHFEQYIDQLEKEINQLLVEVEKLRSRRRECRMLFINHINRIFKRGCEYCSNTIASIAS